MSDTVKWIASAAIVLVGVGGGVAVALYEPKVLLGMVVCVGLAALVFAVKTSVFDD